MMTKRTRLTILIALGVASETIYVLLALVHDLRHHIPFFLVSCAMAFACYWVAAELFFDFRTRSTAGETDSQNWLSRFVQRLKEQEQLSGKKILMVGLLFGVLFRLTLLLASPSLSDDIYRYVWDGRVSSHDINPYKYPPDAAALDFLREDKIYPNINHKEIPTIYPPVNQLTFWGIYQWNTSIYVFKATFLLFDFLTMVVLFFLLKTFDIKPERLLLYVWNPLIIIEIAGSGHVDIVGIFLLTLALLFFLRNKAVLSGVALAFSFLTKYLAIFLLPFISFTKKGKSALIPILMFIIVVAAGYLPFASAKEGLFSALIVYSSKWRFNDSIFAVIFLLIEMILPQSWVTRYMITPYGQQPDPVTLQTRGDDLALFLTKIVVALIFLGIFLYFFLRAKKDFSQKGPIWMFKLGWILFGAFFLLSPTVHPWYVCWLLPFLILVPSRAWILFTGLVMLSYWTLNDYVATGVWRESLAIKLLEYVPFYLVLIYEGLARKRSGQQE